MSDKASPQVRITWPPNDTAASFGGIDVNIVSFDPVGLDTIECTLTIPTFGNVADNERQPYVTATKTPGFEVFSNVHLVPQDRKFNRILARAKDKQGNYGYYDVRIVYPEVPVVGIQWHTFVGMNYLSPVLRRLESQATQTPNKAYETRWMADLKARKVNFIRVPVRWEAMLPYASNQANVLQQLEFLAQECETNGISMTIDCHSVWQGQGLPDYIRTGTSGDADFYLRMYNNNLPFGDFANEAYTKFWKPIIDRIDKYPSVVGYEIFNEPPMLPNTTYQQLGAFHTRIAQKMRASTVKAIIFGQAIPRNSGAATSAALLAQTKPQVSGDIVYGPHCYKADLTGFTNELAEIADTGRLCGNIPVLMGEHAAGLTSTAGAFNTQPTHEMQIREIRARGFGDCYWAFAPSEGVGFHDLVNPDGSLSTTGMMYFNARRIVLGY